ncbi:MAG: chlorite dismutase family protein [Acidobacteria bacterium]|nr:chlorite dismutase family protein [Acidobacteriota bacterium]
MADRMFNFVGGDVGLWQVVKIEAMIGPPLERVARLEVVEGKLDALPESGTWLLRGVTSYERYVTRAERNLLVARQQGLGRPEATCAALIPISKSAAWWELTQDERRAILETQSEHIKTGIKYLPAVARRLHHGRELGEEFDFLTWFEYAPADAAGFEELVSVLRKTEEWAYVEREIDIRLSRTETAA